jgi:hypothetical protein
VIVSHISTLIWFEVKFAIPHVFCCFNKYGTGLQGCVVITLAEQVAVGKVPLICPL